VRGRDYVPGTRVLWGKRVFAFTHKLGLDFKNACPFYLRDISKNNTVLEGYNNGR